MPYLIRISPIVLSAVLAAGFSHAQDKKDGAAAAKNRTLLKALLHADPGIRSRAHQKIVEEGQKSHAAGLIAIVESGSIRDSAIAGYTLTKLPPKLSDENLKRLYGWLSAAGVGDERWSIVAQVLLDDEHSLKDHADAWISVANQSSPFRHALGVQALRQLAESDLEEGVRQSAIAALNGLLARMHEPFQVLQLDDQLLTSRFIGYESHYFSDDVLAVLEVQVALKASPGSIVGPLQGLIARDDEFARLEAARVMGMLEGYEAQAANVMAALAADPYSRVQRSAVIAIGDLGAKASGVAHVLADLLDSGDSTLRRSVAEALGAIGPAAKSALPTLKNALKVEEFSTEENREAFKKAIESIEKVDKPQDDKDNKPTTTKDGLI